MIRYTYVNNQILRIYSALPNLSFPLNIKGIFSLLPNCRYMSYQKLARISNCTLKDVIQLCESKSGCTHYDVSKNRYLVLYNRSTENNNNIGRQRWTCSHELGHIICNHFKASTVKKLAENTFLQKTCLELEDEADYFAATLLSPFPLFKPLNIQSSDDVQKIFGLSREASILRYNQYVNWKQSHFKTAWENDMLKVYKKHFS